MKKTVFGLAAALSVIASASGAQDLDTVMPEEEEQILRAEIREYLLENPEVLLEAQQALQVKQREARAENDGQAIADNAEALYEDEADPLLGNPDGAFTIVKFTDFSCPHCRDVTPALHAFMDAHEDVRVIVKEFPILGERSVTAAKFALAVNELGGSEAYETAQAALFGRKGSITEGFMRVTAKSAGVDYAEVIKAMKSPGIEDQIAENRELAETLGITGTPGLVIEDTIVRGAIPLKGLEQAYAQLSE